MGLECVSLSRYLLDCSANLIKFYEALVGLRHQLIEVCDVIHYAQKNKYRVAPDFRPP